MKESLKRIPIKIWFLLFTVMYVTYSYHTNIHDALRSATSGEKNIYCLHSTIEDKTLHIVVHGNVKANPKFIFAYDIIDGKGFRVIHASLPGACMNFDEVTDYIYGFPIPRIDMQQSNIMILEDELAFNLWNHPRIKEKIILQK